MTVLELFKESDKTIALYNGMKKEDGVFDYLIDSECPIEYQELEVLSFEDDGVAIQAQVLFEADLTNLHEKAIARLRAWRLKRGLTQEQLGLKVGVSVQTVCAYEAGRRDPTLDRFIAMADVLEVSPQELLKDFRYIEEPK